jgi:gas vesicle protein
MPRRGRGESVLTGIYARFPARPNVLPGIRGRILERVELMSDELNDSAKHEEEEDDDSSFSFGLAMLCIGLAAGALAGLLLAPQTGKQMRRRLRRRYEDAREAVEDFGDQAGDWIDKGSEWADKAKGKVSPLTKQFKR